jgi:hypothetical protein
MEAKPKRNTKLTGDLSEITVMLALARMGHAILMPYGENQRYDFVIEEDGKFSRVQVKTGRLRLGSIMFNAQSTHAHRNGGARPYAGEIEFFGVYCPDVERVFLVPVDEVTKTLGCLRWEPTKNKQHRKIRWAHAYMLPIPPEQLVVGLEVVEGVCSAGA